MIELLSSDDFNLLRNTGRTEKLINELELEIGKAVQRKGYGRVVVHAVSQRMGDDFSKRVQMRIKELNERTELSISFRHKPFSHADCARELLAFSENTIRNVIRESISKDMSGRSDVLELFIVDHVFFESIYKRTLDNLMTLERDSVYGAIEIY